MHTLCTPSSFRLPSARRNIPVCSVNGAFSLHSTNGRKQKIRQKALLPRPSDGYRVQNKNASIVSILTFLYGGEGETRTLAPVSRPTPLAGAPRHQLEYFCIGSVYDTIRLLKERAENPLSLLSGGESGIRTHGTLPYDGFQDRSVITTSVSLRIRRKL